MTRPSPPALSVHHVDHLPALLQRVQRWAPWLIVAAASSVVVSFYVMVALGGLAGSVAHRLAGVVAVVTAATVLAIQWVLRVACRSVTATMNDALQSRQQMDAQLRQPREIAGIAVRLQQATSPAELAQTLLSVLAVQVRAYQSLCCLWDEDSRLLQAAARYGGEGETAQEVMTRRSRVGNLIEECARQRRCIQLDAPGAGYLQIGSGLGEMAPASIVLYPVQHGGRLFAVVELATVEPFTEQHLALLQELEPVFATNLDLLQRAQRTQDLLEAARAGEENHRLILGAVGEGVWGVDTHGCTTFVNPAALRLLGYDEAEVLGHRMHDLVHHHHSDGRPYAVADCPIAHTLHDGQSRQVHDEVMWRKDGTPLPVSYITTGIFKGGRIVGAVVVFRESQP